MSLVRWFYDNKATGRPKQVMRVVGNVLFAASIVLFLGVFAGWW